MKITVKQREVSTKNGVTPGWGVYVDGLLEEWYDEWKEALAAALKLAADPPKKPVRIQSPSIVWPIGHREAYNKVVMATAALEAAKRELKDKRSQAQIRCCRCHSEYPIATQTYIQTHWYTPPRGCTGGDYWNQGEAQWSCPSCGFFNRFHDADAPDWSKDFKRPEIVALKGMFRRVEDRYDRS